MTGEVLLLAGPAGAGKSTLARLWCATRATAAAHVQLDAVNELIVSERVDPRDVGHSGQARQHVASVAATCALVRSYAESGMDVAVDDVLPPDEAAAEWLPRLHGLPMRLVVVLPSLETCLARGGGRGKHVPDHLIRAQHEASRRWDPTRCLDTDGQPPEQSLAALLDLLAAPASRWPG